MSSTKYANAVAAVRVMEGKLLTQADMERLLSSTEKDEFPDISSELNNVWEFIRSYAPDCHELEILLYRHNFHNLKAALKALIMNENPQRLFIAPTTLELDLLPKIIASKSYEELPDYMRDAASEAYSILTQSLDGQLADSVIDAACLSAMVHSAEAYDCGFMKNYAQLQVISGDIKTAYRCSLLNKSQQYLEIALCGSNELDKSALIRAASGGTETLLSYLENSGFRQYSDALHESTAAFEKLCDEKFIELAEEAKTKAFGAEPLAAYYIAKETEIKNLRIISVCKSCGVSDNAIRERMRRAYV